MPAAGESRGWSFKYRTAVKPAHAGADREDQTRSFPCALETIAGAEAAGHDNAPMIGVRPLRLGPVTSRRAPAAKAAGHGITNSEDTLPLTEPRSPTHARQIACPSPGPTTEPHGPG